MNISDLKPVANSHFGKITELLNQLYGIRIDWNSSEAHLTSVLEHYEERKAAVLREGVVAMTHPDYTKSILISEAIRIYLREIAPSRKRKTRRVK